MSIHNNDKKQLFNRKKSRVSQLVHSKKAIMSFIIATTVVGGTMVTQGFDGNIEKKEDVITTVQPSYNYFDVSLDNEKKDGLLVEAKAEIVAKQIIEDKRVKEEAEAKAEAERKKIEAELKAKAEAEAKAKAEQEAQAKLKAEAVAKAKAEEDAKAERIRVAKVKAKQKEEKIAKEGFYNRNIPLPKEQQAFLYKKVKERNLNFAEVLAFIKVESDFNPNARSSSSYGLLQINRVNHDMLSRKLGTANTPLDPYVNIEWGTYMIADLYDMYRGRGLSGQELKDAVWSSYNKGVGGFQNTGKAHSYINKMIKAQVNMQSLLN